MHEVKDTSRNMLSLFIYSFIYLLVISKLLPTKRDSVNDEGKFLYKFNKSSPEDEQYTSIESEYCVHNTNSIKR